MARRGDDVLGLRAGRADRASGDDNRCIDRTSEQRQQGAGNMKGMKIDDVKVGEEYGARVVYDTTTRVKVLSIDRVPETSWPQNSRKVRKPFVEILDDSLTKRGYGTPVPRGTQRHVAAREFFGPWAQVAAEEAARQAREADIEEAIDALDAALEGIGDAYVRKGRYGVELSLRPDVARKLADVIEMGKAQQEGQT